MLNNTAKRQMSAKTGMSSTRMVHFSDNIASEESREVEFTNDTAYAVESTEGVSNFNDEQEPEEDKIEQSVSSKGINSVIEYVFGSKISGLFHPNKSNDDEVKSDDEDEKDDEEEFIQSRYICVHIYSCSCFSLIHQR